MTEQQSLTRDPSTLTRRVGWFAIACAAASLALASRLASPEGAFVGQRGRLIAHTMLGGLNRWPRLVRPFLASLVVASLVVV